MYYILTSVNFNKVFFFSQNWWNEKESNWCRNCQLLFLIFQHLIVNRSCCLPLRPCCHHNRAYPTVPQRAIVSENCWRTREERGRGLHVDSVSLRTSNTRQRTAPRRYIQKWRFSHSDNPSSSAFVNVVTIRSLELADRPGGTARRQSEEELT